MNNKGLTLLEMLVVLIILGIFIPLLGKLFLNASIVTSKLNKKIQEASNLNSIVTKTKIEFLEPNENSTLNPVVCFQDNKPVGCTLKKPCVYENNMWKNQNKNCNGGILVVF